MDLGTLLDYCQEWNEAHGMNNEEPKKPKARQATQADWDRFFG